MRCVFKITVADLNAFKQDSPNNNDNINSKSINFQNKTFNLGSEKFQGNILHVGDYRNSEGFEDKRVVVLGNGNNTLCVDKYT